MYEDALRADKFRKLPVFSGFVQEVVALGGFGRDKNVGHGAEYLVE